MPMNKPPLYKFTNREVSWFYCNTPPPKKETYCNILLHVTKHQANQFNSDLISDTSLVDMMIKANCTQFSPYFPPIIRR